ncbi:fucosyltransferase [Pseudoscourfieldia marina]
MTQCVHLLAVLGLLFTHCVCVSWALDGRSRLNTILSKVAHIKHVKKTRLAVSARLHARRLPRRSHIATQSSLGSFASFNTVLSQDRRSEDNARTCHAWCNVHNVPVVVERYKLVFFTTPGVAQTEFEQLLRRMSPDTSDELTYLDAYPFETAFAMLRNDSWTKAIFFRSPVNRFVSGYSATKVNEDTDMDLGTFVSKVERGWSHPSQAYWKSQCEYVHLCDAILPFMNFVGDFGNLANDTRRLLERVGAWDARGFDTEARGEGSCTTFCGHEHESLPDLSNDVLHRIERLVGTDIRLRYTGTRRKYFWCGYGGVSIPFAIAVFEMQKEQLAPYQGNSSPDDILFVSGTCRQAKAFSGRMMTYTPTTRRLLATKLHPPVQTLSKELHIATLVSPAYLRHSDKLIQSIMARVNGEFELSIKKIREPPLRKNTCTYENKLCGWSDKVRFIAQLLQVLHSGTVLVFFDATTELVESISCGDFQEALAGHDIICRDERGGCNLGVLVIKNSHRTQRFFERVAQIVEMGFWDQGTVNLLLNFTGNYYVQKFAHVHERFHGYERTQNVKVGLSLRALERKIVKRMISQGEYMEMHKGFQ